MSKAFTKDEAVTPELQWPVIKDRHPMTPDGYEALSHDLRVLLEVERPRLFGHHEPDSPTAQAAMRELDQRIYALSRRAELAHVIEPPLDDAGRVYFGSEVTVQDEDGHRVTYRIVGPDEINLKRHWVSHVSPVGQALLGKRVGDVTTVVRPKGDLDYEIIAVHPYETVSQ